MPNANDALLKTFQKAYQNLDITPLLSEKQVEQFGVEYGTEVLEELVQLVEDNAARDGKIMFSGHRGCGKSTLLSEFGRQCADRYFVVFFSIAETMEMSGLSHIDILFAVSVNLMLQAENAKVNISKSTKDSLYKWFANRTQTDIKTVEGSIGFDLFKIITGKLKTESSTRNELKREFGSNISSLISKLNEIAAIVQLASKKEVLVIIDDLDKLDLADVRSVYQDHIKALFLPGFSIVFTLPVSSLRDASLLATLQTETNDQIIEMPISKLYAKGERQHPDPTVRQEALHTLCQVLHKRLTTEIIEPEVAERLVLQSGGVLREVVRIANRCCRICLRQIRRDPERTDIKINHAVLEEALTDLRLDFETTLGKTDFEILSAVYQKSMPEDPKAQPFLDLLHGLDVLEYRNAEVWYDVHPIVTNLLQRKGLL